MDDLDLLVRIYKRYSDNPNRETHHWAQLRMAAETHPFLLEDGILESSDEHTILTYKIVDWGKLGALVEALEM